MQISSRFTIALHIFACVETFKDEYKVTSDFLAGSINTNPVIIRRILTQLKSAGLITVARGTGGIEPTRALEEISFYDVYQAIEPVENGDLFHFHEAPNPKCPVGRNIHALLDDKLTAIQNAMENEMRKYTLADLDIGASFKGVHMEVKDYLAYIVNEIHTTIVATVDDEGLPVTAAIDMMDSDENGLYFLTAKGKGFYDRLVKRGFLALTAIKGQDTMSSVAVSVRGKVKELGYDRIPLLFEKNPYMHQIYPTDEAMHALTVFQIYEGTGEWFDLSKKPIERASFIFGIFPLSSIMPARLAVPTSVPIVSNISIMQNVMISVTAVKIPSRKKSPKSNLNRVSSTP